MKRLSIIGVLFVISLAGYGQSGDSLRTQFLEEIVIQNTATEGDTSQNFYRANASATTESILSRMRGVSLIRRGAFGQEPVLRSLSGGQLNVTIDGMKIFGACTDKMDPVSIYVEPQNLGSMQVITGPAGAAFGSTVGGSVNMKLADPQIGHKPISGVERADYQTAANAFTMSSRVNVSQTQNAFLVTSTYRKSQNYRAGGGSTIPFSQYEKLNVSAAGKWTLGKYDTLTANGLFDRGSNIGFAGLPMDVRKATAGLVSAGWERVAPWWKLNKASVKVYHNDIRHQMDDWSRPDVSHHMDMPGASQTSGMLAEADVHLFHRHRTLVKAEYYVNRLVGEMTMYSEDGRSMYMQTAPASHRQNTGLFINQAFRVTDRSRANLSFRMDINRDKVANGIGLRQWQVFDPEISNVTVTTARTVSASFDTRIAGNLRLELQAGIGERIPTLNERFGYYLFNRFDGFDYLGNPELKNETSFNAETAIVAFLGNSVEIEISPYFQRFSNYILGVGTNYSAMTTDARGVKQYDNIPTATLYGADVLFMTRLMGLQWITNLKYTSGSDESGDPLPLIPPLKAVTTVKYNFRAFTTQVEWEWADAQLRVSKDAHERPTPAWSVLSVRTGYQINSFLNCSAGVENLFDRNYREHLDVGGIPRPGRNIYLNLTYSF
jgi:iron complex outermembrane receptor protein